jgi:hypothetical protein
MLYLRKFVLTTALIIGCHSAVAQEDTRCKEDLGGVAAFIIKKDWNEKWYSFIYCQYEQRDMFRNTELYYARIVGRYKIKPWLHVGLSYDNMNYNLGQSEGYLRGHRTLVDILAIQRWGDFNFTWMEREYIYLYSEPKTSTPHFLFNFVRVEYVPDTSRVHPYVFGVLVNTYYSFNEIWAQAGMKIRLDSKNSLNLYYLHKSFLTSSSGRSYLGIEYNLSL